MKRIFVLLNVITLMFAGCKVVDDDPVVVSLGQGVFIVNQGNFTAGNASLSYFEPGILKKYNNLFSDVNGIPLGDVAQSITLDDSNAYIVVNNSGLIQVLGRWNAKFKGKISNLGSPRYMLKISENKAYVSDLFKNAITIIDPASLQVTGEIPVGRSTEEMVRLGNSVFAANWTGYNQSAVNDKVLVIDVDQDKLVDSIQVGIEPNSMVLDKNNTLWVLCSGGYENTEIPSLWKIDANTRQVIDTLIFPELASNPNNLEQNGDRDSLFYLNYGIFRMSIGDTTLPEDVFIGEDPDMVFLCLGVDPTTSEIYVSDPKNYQVNGRVYRFGPNGGMRSNMEVGIVPGAFGFNY